MRGVVLFLAAIAACVDAAPAPAPATFIDPDIAWTPHTIYNGLVGADGHALGDVDGDGDLDALVAWEQSAKVSISLQPIDATAPWPTTVLFALAGAEDVDLALLDDDDCLDAIGAGQGKKILVAFGNCDGTFTSATTITVATGLQYWMQIDAVGGVIYAGGRVANPPKIVALRPGSDPRDGAGWTLTELGNGGWIMSLVARDLDGDGDTDLLLSDRQWFTLVAGGPRTYDLMGVRWLEQAAGGAWTNHPIAAPPTGRTARFVADGGAYVVGGFSPDAGNLSTLAAYGGWAGWAPTPIPWPATLGGYQAGRLADVDGDGLDDIVVSASEAAGTLEGVAWLRAPTWAPGSISGPAGTKFDELDVVDIDRDGRLDVVTTEQTDGLGLVWYARP